MYVQGQSITGAVSPYQEVIFIYSLSNDIMTAGNQSIHFVVCAISFAFFLHNSLEIFA